MEAILERFFLRDYEKSINMKMMYYDYQFPFEEMIEYVNYLLCVPVEEYLAYIDAEKNIIINSSDVFQFSNFNDATINLCCALSEMNNPGVLPVQTGKILLGDNPPRKEGAYRKYGENHLKAGEQIGLTFRLGSTFFLSSLGMIYKNLDEQQRARLTVRLLIRNPLIKYLIKTARKQKIELRQVLCMLSDSTFRRRRSSTKDLIDYLSQSDEFDFSEIFANIDFGYVVR